MCVTDAFSKFAELIAIPDKHAETVANALYTRWLCRHGLPLEIVSDQGKEFCNEVVDKLLELLKVKKQQQLHTTLKQGSSEQNYCPIS